MRTLLFLFFLICFSALSNAQTPHLFFHTELSSNSLVPPGNAPGLGMVSVLFSAEQSTILLNGMLLGLDGMLTGASIRAGKFDENGPEILDILPLISGKRVGGELPAPAGLLARLLRNEAYLEVTTSTSPGGALRGQFEGESDVDSRVMLSGDQMVPPVSTNGFAFGGLHFPTGSEDVDYVVLVSQLSSALTGAALYRGLPGENGQWIADLNGNVGGIILGLKELDELEPDFVRHCKNGAYYIVVKTVNHPDGELRGQVNFMGYLNSFAPVNGVQQVPSVSTPGFALNHTQPNASLDSLTTTVFITQITPLSVDIHLAPTGQTGPIQWSLQPAGVPGLYTATYPVTPAQFEAFVAGKLYLNVPTSAFPSGEIRGQLKNSLRKAYSFDLCGDQVAPPVNTPAFGAVMASVDQANCYIHYKVIQDDLSSNLVAGFIAQAPAGSSGPVLHTTPTQLPLLEGEGAIAAGEGVLIESGGTYLQMHTVGYPNGEIRGQIRRGLFCPEISADTEPPVHVTHLYPNPASQQFFLDIGTVRVAGTLQLTDALGRLLAVREVQAGSSSQTFSFSVQHYPPGAYYLQFQTANACLSLGRVLKQRK